MRDVRTSYPSFRLDGLSPGPARVVDGYPRPAAIAYPVVSPNLAYGVRPFQTQRRYLAGIQVDDAAISLTTDQSPGGAPDQMRVAQHKVDQRVPVSLEAL